MKKKSENYKHYFYSFLAYGNLYIYLGWKGVAKERLEKAIKIVEEDIEMYGDNSPIQDIAFDINSQKC